MKASITYSGVPMDCTFSYEKGYAATLEEPGEPESVTLESCEVRGVDIFDLLSKEQEAGIGTALLEWVAEDRFFQACEHADMVRDERRLGSET